jgi:signal transduction histidine kinase
MRRKLLIIFLLIISFCTLVNALEPVPLAKKGVLDLRSIPDPFSFKISLNGEWEFYWNKMLRPDDFSSGHILPEYYGRVPAYWTEYQQDHIKTEGKGYATYRLTILLPKDYHESLGLDLPIFDSSYEIFVDGKKLGENGIPGRTAAETKPEYRRNFFRISPASDSLNIIIIVANFDHRRGGFWLPAKFGSFRAVQRNLAASWAASWSVISLLMGFSIFFLFFLILSPREKIMGYFSLATFGLALRPLFTSHFLILNLFDMNWEWIVRFEYLSLYLVIVGWSWVAFSLYPSRIIRTASYFISVSYIIAFILTLFLPVKIFALATYLTYTSVFFLASYLIFHSFLGTLRKRRLDFAYLLMFLMVFFAACHDIRVSLGRSTSEIGYVVTYMIVVFVFFQAILLLYKWIKAFFEKERLQNELEFMNRNLENLVNERTLQLKTRTLEIENKNTRIALQNKQLSDTIQLKNKIFSVIAHDLRGPIVNILYMLNLLKEKDYKENYDTFANSSIQYAQNVITLLENMLVWGRDQEDKIKFAPGNRDLAEIILTNLSIIKETADKKNIIMNFTQIGTSVAFFDKDLLDIVIRNILSNAIKYTHKGGRISILLKDKFQGEKGIMLKICDNGVGIPENKQKNLFSSAEIISTPGTEDEKGTGLGLKLCYELVRLNNGTISVKSRSGEGTCFIISLPVR